MRIRWLGHSAFAITAADGRVILTDPFEAGGYGGAVGYKKIDVKADIATVSHNHPDHSGGVKSLPGKPQIIDKVGDYNISGIRIKGILTDHDSKGGKERGKNIIFIYEIDGIRLAHLGDLGHIPSDEQIKAVGPVDVLMIPVGGHFTIDAAQATEVVEKLKPRVVIPMHYKTEVLDFPIVGVDAFLSNKSGIKRLDSSSASCTKDSLPKTMEIWVLRYE